MQVYVIEGISSSFVFDHLGFESKEGFQRAEPFRNLLELLVGQFLSIAEFSEVLQDKFWVHALHLEIALFFCQWLEMVGCVRYTRTARVNGSFLEES